MFNKPTFSGIQRNGFTGPFRLTPYKVEKSIKAQFSFIMILRILQLHELYRFMCDLYEIFYLPFMQCFTRCKAIANSREESRPSLLRSAMFLFKNKINSERTYTLYMDNGAWPQTLVECHNTLLYIQAPLVGFSHFTLKLQVVYQQVMLSFLSFVNFEKVKSPCTVISCVCGFVYQYTVYTVHTCILYPPYFRQNWWWQSRSQ